MVYLLIVISLLIVAMIVIYSILCIIFSVLDIIKGCIVYMLPIIFKCIFFCLKLRSMMLITNTIRAVICVEKNNMYRKFINKLYNVYTWIIDRINKNLNRESSQYNIPAITLPWNGIIVQIMVDMIQITNNKKLDYIYCVLLLLFIYLVGMFTRYYGDFEEYMRCLECNLEFFKLSLIPCSFFIISIGFIDTIKNQFEIDILGKFTVIDIINEVENISYLDGYSGILKFIYIIAILSLLVYISSLPFRLLGYFMVNYILYFCKYRKEYNKIFLKFKKFILILIRNIIV